MLLNCRRMAVLLLFGVSLCACSAMSPAEAPPTTPETKPRPIPVPDLPPVAIAPKEDVIKPKESAPRAVVQPVRVDSDRSVFFLPRMSTVGDGEKEKLKECADQLKQNPKQIVLLTSYSDDLGSKSYNLAISEQRIAAVGSALRSLGVERRQIRRNRSNSVKTTAHACRAEDCRQQMRRVEFLCGA